MVRTDLDMVQNPIVVFDTKENAGENGQEEALPTASAGVRVSHVNELQTFTCGIDDDPSSRTRFGATTFDALVQITTKLLEKRDFGGEVRPGLDCKHCLFEAIVLLDTVAVQVDDVVAEMVQQVILQRKESEAISREAVSAIYADKKSCTFAETIKAIRTFPESNTVDYDQSWLITMCSLPSLMRRHVVLARLRQPMNFGSNATAVRFFALVLTPTEVKMTKSASELGKTLATLLADPVLRSKLDEAPTPDHFMAFILNSAEQLANGHSGHSSETPPAQKLPPLISFCTGLAENFRRRSKYYASDFVDGVRGDRTLQKVLSTTFFLYFLCILPCIAFGVLNAKNTSKKIDADRALIGQAIGGLVWGFTAGQPLVIIATTAPIALCNKIVFELSEALEIEFYTMYAWVGLWNAFFLALYGLFGLSSLIRFSTRSVEEIFSMFIVICFTVDALKDLVKNYSEFYGTAACLLSSSSSGFVRGLNETENKIIHPTVGDSCQRDNFLLFFILMVGTLWLAVRIYDFKDTPYLSRSKRVLLSDYALPIAVVVFTVVGSYLFNEVHVETFPVTGTMTFAMAKLGDISLAGLLASLGLGFAVSLLFFMDQGVSAQLVDAPTNKLKKGNATHLDFVLVAVINGLLSIFGLPWMHGLLPHSPLHVQSLADVEERVDNGHVHQVVVRVRETRLTGILCHVLIGCSVLFIPRLFATIPVPVLDGLFLYCAVASLRGNSFSERISLVLTEQTKYPPTHYVRRCPQRQIHVFTACQALQLLVLVGVGYAPWAYLQMTFPLFIALLIPIRHILMPRLMEKKHLNTLDGYE